MGSKNSAPPPPDLSAVANASKEAAQLQYKLGQEQLAWAKEQYANDRTITDKVVDSFITTQDENLANARKDRERYERVFQPQEDALVQDANTYASEGKKDLERGRAQAAVGQQFDAARDAAVRQLESFGVNPASTRFAALDIGTRAQEAAAKAAAGNQADLQTEATARALRDQAINVGKGYPAQTNAAYGTANNSGAGAVNSSLATTASGANTMGTGTQWTGLGNQSTGQWGNTLNAGYQNELNAWKANQSTSSGIGSALGLMGSALLGGTKPWIFAAEGGAIDPEATPGGAIPIGASPSGGKAVDDVSARLTAGEFVVPKDVASWYGEKHLQSMIQKARTEKERAVAKPDVREALPTTPTFQSRPSGAIPLGAAA